MSQVKRSFEKIYTAFNNELLQPASGEKSKQRVEGLSEQRKVAHDAYWGGRVDTKKPAFTGDLSGSASYTTHMTPRGVINVVNPPTETGYTPTIDTLNFPMLGQESFTARLAPLKTKY